jgi:hypothetical protein
MGDVIRQCVKISYDTSLINLYYNGNLISDAEFTNYIKLPKDDTIKHNKIGELLQRSITNGITNEIKDEAEYYGVLDYLHLIKYMSGV